MNRIVRWFVPAVRVLLLVVALSLQNYGLAGAQAGYQLPFSDEMVAEFARVKLRMDEIKAEYNERIRAADTHEEALRLAQDAREMAALAIRDSALSFDLYQRMLAEMRNDAAFRSRVLFFMGQLDDLR